MKNNEVLYSAVPVLEQNDNSVETDRIKITSFQSDKEPIDKSENVKTTEEIKPETYPPLPFHKLYKYSDTFEKCLLSIGAASAVVSGLCQTTNTFIFGNLIGAMVETTLTTNTIALADAVSTFVTWNSIAGVTMLIFSYISIMIFNYAGQRQIYRIRNMYLESALHQDISWYDLNQSGDIASRLAEDITKLEEGISEKAVLFVHNATAFVGCLALAFIRGWKFALVCMITFPITLGVVALVVKISGQLARKEIEAYAKAGTIAEEVISAMRTVVAFGGQKLELKRYTENLIYAYTNNVKRSFLTGLGFGGMMFFLYSSYAFSYWYGVGLIIAEKDLPPSERTYDAATVVMVFFGVMTGSMIFSTASSLIEDFGIAKAAGSKIFAVINRKSLINSLSNDGDKPIKFRASIDFKNVSFSYPSRPDIKILRDINLSINHGETVALVGGSGCGKSTCIQLLQRFYDPDSGQVLLDGYDLKDLNVAWLRSNIGVVGQEPVLFGTTIAENIRYGKMDATDEEIVTAAKEANAHDFIMKLENGYETMVGERGAQMSGGQKQRIAIARALVRNPMILLLDEATSALDTRSEARVQAALDKASQGRTTIIVAHRLSTIRGADKIIVLSDGVVVEQGNHKELMALKTHYYGLVTSQVSDLEESGLEKKKARGEKENEYEDEQKIVLNTKFNEEEEEEEEELEKSKQVSMMSVLRYNKPERYHIFGACLVSIVLGWSTHFFAIICGDLLGVLSDPDPENVRNGTNKYCLYFVFAGILTGFATFIQSLLLGIAGERLTKRLRGLAFGTMLKQEIAWFDMPSHGTGSLCAKLSGEAAAVKGATGERIGTLIRSASTMIMSLTLALYYDWRLGLVGSVFIPFILITNYMQGLITKHEVLNYHKTLEQSTKIAVEAVTNIRTVVGLGREKTFKMGYMEAMKPSFEIAKRNTHIRAMIIASARSIIFFTDAVCMWYGGILIVEQGLSYTIVFKVGQALVTGTIMTANALVLIPNYQKGLIAAGKIFALVNRSPKIVDPVNPQEDKWANTGDVNYKSVTFEYPTRPGLKVLQDLDLKVPSGKTVALIGSSGCGKSTIIQLLERFYDPNSGSIILGNRDISSVTLASLRFSMGIVSQEPTLFARTIAENIAYGDNMREVPITEVVSAAKKANIHEFITSLPLGYDTKLGDKGTQISGGQKQRIAIARALISNPKILLLDEATSALDAESEKIVQAALDDAKEGRTCITIAHRLSTIQDADKICVLDSGIVAESGTHAELVAKKGLYYKLLTSES